MSQPFLWERRVEFCETDAAGIVHFSQLIVYMEQAEHALLRSIGLSVAAHATSRPRQERSSETDLLWPRVAVECQFRSPARFEDVLTILVSVSKLGDKSITYSHRLLLGSQAVAEGTMTCVCCSNLPNGLQSVPIPEAVRQLLNKFA